MKGSFLFLGSGSSAGVPLIGCTCSVCTSSSPKNKRLRPSGLLSVQGKSLLVDIGPDFRTQALHFQITTLDGLLLTHTHYDHIAGIDEVRIFNLRRGSPLPCLLSKESFEEIRKRYYYFFDERSVSAKFSFTVVEKEEGEVSFLGVPIAYCSFTQAGAKVTGFRIGEFAYICDIQTFSDSVVASLRGVRKLVLSALKPDPSPFHFSFEEAALFARRVGASETWLTHINHSLDHEALNALLPPEIRVAYDGLKLEFSCTN